MTLLEVHVKWSVILMDRLGPNIYIVHCALCTCAFKSAGLVISLEWASVQKIAYVFGTFEQNEWRLRKLKRQ